MKKYIAALCLVPVIAFAQSHVQIPRAAGPPGYTEERHPLPNNYQVTLTILDKDQRIAELAFITTAPEFKAEMSDPAVINFSGELTADENDKDATLLRIQLGAQIEVPVGNSTQYKTSTVQTSVRAQLDKPIDFYKTGTRTYRLTVSRLPKSGEPGK